MSRPRGLGPKMPPKGPAQGIAPLTQSPTPRSGISDNNFNLRLTFKGEVLRDSYLFVGGFVKGVEVDKSKERRLHNLISSYLSGQLTVEGLINEVRRVMDGLVKVLSLREVPKYRDKVIIPSSSIKGAIRSRIEYKLPPDLSCYRVRTSKLPSREYYKRHVAFWGDDIIKDRVACNPLETGEACIVCDLFGAPGLASRVYFSDLEMMEGSCRFLKDLRVEAVEPESKFKLMVDLINCSFLDLGLLFLGFELFTGSPIMLGAYKYRYNPKAQGFKYQGKYYFGLMRFELESFTEVLSRNLEGINKDSLIDRARQELERKLQDRMESTLKRGVLKL